jgi:hypothetical protein
MHMFAYAIVYNIFCLVLASYLLVCHYLNTPFMFSQDDEDDDLEYLRSSTHGGCLQFGCLASTWVRAVADFPWLRYATQVLPFVCGLVCMDNSMS